MCRGCAYTVLKTVQRHGVYSAAYGTVHYKEPLKSFETRVGHNPGLTLSSVAILGLGLFPKNRNSLHTPPPPLRHRFHGFFLIPGHISFKFKNSNQKLKCPKYVISTLLTPEDQK